MGSLFIHIYNWGQKNKFFFRALILLIIALCAFLALRIKFEEDITKVMPVDERLHKIYHVIEKSKITDRIVVTIGLKDTSIVSTDKVIEAADQLQMQLEYQKPQYISEIVMGANDEAIQSLFESISRNLPIYLDSIDYVSIDRKTTPDEIKSSMEGGYKLLMTPAGAYLKNNFVSDPLGLAALGYKKAQTTFNDGNYRIIDNHIFSSDEKVLIFFIKPAFPAKESSVNAELISRLDEIIGQLNPELEVNYFGSPVVAAGNASRIKKDLNVIISIILVVLFLLLSLYYRSFYHFFILIVPVVIGGFAGLAMLYLLKEKVSVISLGVGSILLGITIDYSLHIFTHFKKVQDVSTLLKDISNSLLMSSLTTVAAFLCLLYTDSEALRQLGIFASFSFVASVLSALIVLPHFLKKDSKGQHSLTEIEILPRLKIRLGLLFSLLLFISIGSYYISRNPVFEKDLEAMNYMSPELKKSEEKLNQITGVSLKSIFLVTRGATLSEALLKLENVYPALDSMHRKGLIKKIKGIAPLLISKQEALEKLDRWRNYWTESKKAEVKRVLETEATRLGFKINAFQPFIEIINATDCETDPLIIFEKNKQIFGDFVHLSDSNVSVITILNADEKNRGEIYSALGSHTDVLVFDKKLMSENMANALGNNFNALVNLSLILVFLILLIAYGRIELAIITFLPILVSWYWTLGVMILFGLKLNIINIIVCTFVFGLGIDYSIFIMNGLIQGYAAGTSNVKSYKSSIYLSAFTTLIGIGGMIFAQHPALRSIASLGIIGITSVLVLSNLFIPLAFDWLVLKRTMNRKYPLTFKNMLATLLAYVMLIIGFLVITILALLAHIFIFIPSKNRKIFIHYLLFYWAKIYVNVLFFNRKRILQKEMLDFKTPSVIVANHQSFIDVPFIFSLSPRVILTTNSRIYHNPIFGPISRLCDFLNVENGIENMEVKVRQLIDDGYSIVIFPEGTRSTDNQIHRFHKGAFKLAIDFNVNITPIVIHGTGEFLPKGEFWGRPNNLTVKVLNRIETQGYSSELEYSNLSKIVCSQMRLEFEKIKQEYAGPDYCKELLVLSTVYKSPFLEWYQKVKLKLENNYLYFHQAIPKAGLVYDLGCGFGFSTFVLGLASPGRRMVGVDYDAFKIKVANQNYFSGEQIHFVSDDISTLTLEPCEGIIFSDVLHYLEPKDQRRVLEHAMQVLKINGIIVIKDGDSKVKRKQKLTKITEIFSTKLLKFNKTVTQLNFISADFLKALAEEKNYVLEEIESSKFTSNKLWILKHK